MEKQSGQASVERYRVLLGSKDSALEEIAQLAADICGGAEAHINLLGLPDATGAHRLAGSEIEDAGDFSRGSSLSVPIIAPDSLRVGAICVFHIQPTIFTQHQLSALERLARITAYRLEARLLKIAKDAAERVAEKEHEFLNAVLENLGDGLVACNAEGELTLFNRALRDFHGLDPDASLKPEEWSSHYKLYLEDGQTLMTPDQIPLVRIFNGEILKEVSMVVAAASGKRTSLVARGRALIGKDGQKLGAVCLMRDTTELKLKEQKLLETNRALQAATDAKSEFLANMSHEIRTPLNGIVGMTELVLDSDLDRDQREQLQTIRSSADNLITIVSDILDFSKIEAGKLEIEKIDFDIGNVFEDVFRTLEFAASEKGLALKHLVPLGTVTRFSGDPGRLRQIFMNLVNNAIKFTPEGFIETSLTMIPKSNGQTMIHVRVKDSGLGVSEATKLRLFEAFAQADSSTTRKYGGTGLGLSISKRLLDLMGGEIGVESELGKGSTFWFSVTLDAAVERLEVALAKTPIGHQVETSAGILELKILLAEDNLVNQRIALKMLAKLGLSADTADNGLEVMSAIRAVKYDLVLMDCQMPEMDGYEAAKGIRLETSRAGEPGPKIVALTANAMKGDREKCIAAGMDDYISKPFRIDDLRAAISRHFKAA